MITRISPIGRKGNKIVAFQLTERDEMEVIVIYDNGDVVFLEPSTGVTRTLHTLAFPPEDLELQIHSFGNYICVVQKHGLQGVVLNLDRAEFKKELSRGAYLPEHCVFSIGFYLKNRQTFLIHSTEWNRLDITCLDTGNLITDRIVDYDTDQNYFDYFHSSILVSPDFSKFTSNGWIWQPWDIITVYEIEKFLGSFEAAHFEIEIGDFGERGGYNWDRPLCWIDSDTLGIGHNKGEKIEDRLAYPSEILIYGLKSQTITRHIEFDGFAVEEYGEAKGELSFDTSNKRFIGLNRQTGLLVTDEEGRVVHKDANVTSSRYSTRHQVLFHLDIESDSIVFNDVIP